MQKQGLGRTAGWLLVGALLAATLAIAARPLGELLSATGRTLLITRQILAETRLLQREVERVQANLAQMERQEELLDQQAAHMAELLSLLHRQEELATGTSQLITAILGAEREALALTRQADQNGLATLETVAANSVQLLRLAEATGRVQAQTLRLDSQMDQLLLEMEVAAESFAAVDRLRRAAGQVNDRATNWWRRILEWFSW